MCSPGQNRQSLLPPARKERSVLYAVLIAIVLSCAMTYIPGLNQISSGFAVIICAVLASAFCAWRFPIKTEENNFNINNKGEQAK